MAVPIGLAPNRFNERLAPQSTATSLHQVPKECVPYLTTRIADREQYPRESWQASVTKPFSSRFSLAANIVWTSRELGRGWLDLLCML